MDIRNELTKNAFYRLSVTTESTAWDKKNIHHKRF